MIATYIDAVLLRPGYRMEGTHPPRDRDQIYGARPELGFALLDPEALSVYSVDRKKAIPPEDVTIDADGLLTETIFAVTGITDIEPYAQLKATDCTSGWFREMLLECDDLSNEIEAIWSDFAPDFANAKPGLQIQMAGAIGCWEMETSRGYYDLYPEVEFINYVGRGTVSVLEEK